MIPYGRQEITQQDIDAVAEVLRSDFPTQGPKVPLLEQIVAIKVGAKHALAVNSATSGPHIACMALSLGAWRLALDPADHIRCICVNCVACSCGASVDFVDIDPQHIQPYVLRLWKRN